MKQRQPITRQTSEYIPQAPQVLQVSQLPQMQQIPQTSQVGLMQEMQQLQELRELRELKEQQKVTSQQSDSWQPPPLKRRRLQCVIIGNYNPTGAVSANTISNMKKENLIENKLENQDALGHEVRQLKAIMTNQKEAITTIASDESNHQVDFLLCIFTRK